MTKTHYQGKTVYTVAAPSRATAYVYLVDGKVFATMAAACKYITNAQSTNRSNST